VIRTQTSSVQAGSHRVVVHLLKAAGAGDWDVLDLEWMERVGAEPMRGESLQFPRQYLLELG
jgi:hypothetical protein